MGIHGRPDARFRRCCINGAEAKNGETVENTTADPTGPRTTVREFASRNSSDASLCLVESVSLVKLDALRCACDVCQQQICLLKCSIASEAAAVDFVDVFPRISSIASGQRPTVVGSFAPALGWRSRTGSKARRRHGDHQDRRPERTKRPSPPEARETAAQRPRHRRLRVPRTEARRTCRSWWPRRRARALYPPSSSSRSCLSHLQYGVPDCSLFHRFLILCSLICCVVFFLFTPPPSVCFLSTQMSFNTYLFIFTIIVQISKVHQQR